jgi:hypothetical protein
VKRNATERKARHDKIRQAQAQTKHQAHQDKLSVGIIIFVHHPKRQKTVEIGKQQKATVSCLGEKIKKTTEEMKGGKRRLSVHGGPVNHSLLNDPDITHEGLSYILSLASAFN